MRLTEKDYQELVDSLERMSKEEIDDLMEQSAIDARLSEGKEVSNMELFKFEVSARVNVPDSALPVVVHRTLFSFAESDVHATELLRQEMLNCCNVESYDIQTITQINDGCVIKLAEPNLMDAF